MANPNLPMAGKNFLGIYDPRAIFCRFGILAGSRRPVLLVCVRFLIKHGLPTTPMPSPHDAGACCVPTRQTGLLDLTDMADVHDSITKQAFGTASGGENAITDADLSANDKFKDSVAVPIASTRGAVSKSP